MDVVFHLYLLILVNMNPNGTQAKQSQGNVTMGHMKNVSYTSPIPEMFNAYMQPHDSLPANKWHKESALNRAIRYQKTPYADPTQLSKGNTITNAGGSFILYDKTGGTQIFTYDPVTGVVTINGSLIANNSNTGTYTNIVLAGTDLVIGTMVNGVYGTPQVIGGSVNNASIGTSTITGGTMNPTVYQNGGTVGISAAIVFVRSVSPGTVLGTLTFTGGILTGTS